MLAWFVKENNYERAARGRYKASGAWPDDYCIWQLRYPQLIFSHLSALRGHDLTGYLPNYACVTLWTGCNPGRLSADGAKFLRSSASLYELGRTYANPLWQPSPRV